jgi:prefoldin subunit 5
MQELILASNARIVEIVGFGFNIADQTFECAINAVARQKEQYEKRLVEATSAVSDRQSDFTSLALRIRGIVRDRTVKGMSVFGCLDQIQDEREKLETECERLRLSRLLFRDCLLGLAPDLRDSEELACPMRDSELVNTLGVVMKRRSS